MIDIEKIIDTFYLNNLDMYPEKDFLETIHSMEVYYVDFVEIL